MITIKVKLKDIIEKIMIPESKAFIEELNETIKISSTQDDIDAKEDMEYFLDELNAVLKAIEKDEISDDEAQSVYEKITHMLEEHIEEH